MCAAAGIAQCRDMIDVNAELDAVAPLEGGW